MLIQPIANRSNYSNYLLQNKKNNTAFNGELGKKMLYELSTREGLHSNLIPSVVKIYGGFWGRFSASNLKDILETFVDEICVKESKIESLKKDIDELKAANNEEKQAIRNNTERLIAKENELADEKRKLSLKEQNFNTEKRDYETSLKQRQMELSKLEEQSKLRKKQLDTKEQELNEREQRIINETRANETEKIRKEEKQAALDDLGERILALSKQEAAVKEKEEALIKTEKMLRDSEIEQMRSDFRVLYGIENPKIDSYNYFSEQMVTITQILNAYYHKLKGISASTPGAMIKLLQNEEGAISREKIQFLERILKSGKLYDTQDLSHTITTVMKVSDNMNDSSKVAHFITLLSLYGVSIVSAIKNYASHYNVKSVFDNIEDGKIAEIVRKMQEDQKACGLNAYGFRHNIETAEKLYKDFNNIKDLSLYSLDELNNAIRDVEKLIDSETNRTPAENFKKMITKIQEAINNRKQI